jgi:selenocysteine lyase/cysteine desulfurase
MKAIHQRLSARVRPQFPALQRTIDGKPVASFDGPGGTQVPRGVADAVSDFSMRRRRARYCSVRT